MCYASPVVAAMQARRALDPFSMARSRPPWSYHQTGTLPRLIFFVCHSYENTGGVGVFFPFWNSTASPAPASSNRAASPFIGLLFTDRCRLTTVNYSVLLLSKLKAPISRAESTLSEVFFLKNLKPFAINTFGKQGEGYPLWLTNCSKKVYFASWLSFQSLPGVHLATASFSGLCRNGGRGVQLWYS